MDDKPHEKIFDEIGRTMKCIAVFLNICSSDQIKVAAIANVLIHIIKTQADPVLARNKFIDVLMDNIK